jgi:spore germination protein GerM
MVSVERVIQKTKTPIQDTLQLLLKGELTESEKKEEVTSLFPLESFSLKSASLDNNGALTLIFEDPLFKSSGGSCKVSVLRKQIEMTAKQFSVVNDIVFLPEGVFQP